MVMLTFRLRSTLAPSVAEGLNYARGQELSSTDADESTSTGVRKLQASCSNEASQTHISGVAGCA
jgi:putative transposase